MNRRAPKRGAARGGATRGGSARGGSPRSGKRPVAQGKRSAPQAKQTPVEPQAAPLPPIRLGFVRGVAPSKWAERWARAVREQQLELVPVGLGEVDAARSEVDVLLERVTPGSLPFGTEAPAQVRHALRLYEEGVALVLNADHEIASQQTAGLEDLELVTLLSHPDHHPEWPSAQPWQDPAWAPTDAEATLELVATGVGGALMPLPLARHLARKRTHAVLPVVNGAESLLTGTKIWATWAIERDANDVQRLIGVLRGRTARSSR